MTTAWQSSKNNKVSSLDHSNGPGCYFLYSRSKKEIQLINGAKNSYTIVMTREGPSLLLQVKRAVSKADTIWSLIRHFYGN